MRTIIFQILVELAFISYLFLALREKKYAPFLTKTHWWFIGGAIILTFTSLVSLDPRASFFSDTSRADGLLFLFHVGLYVFLLSWMIKEKADLEFFFKVAIFTGLPTLFLTTLLSLPWFKGSGFAFSAWTRNLVILAGNENFFAHYLLLLFSFNAYFILTRPRPSYLITAVTLFIFIALTLSAGAFLLTLAFSFILLWLGSKRTFYTCSILGGGILLYGALTSNSFFLRMFSIAGGFLARWEVWKEAAKTVLYTHPFLGFGWGNGELVWNFAQKTPPGFFVGQNYSYVFPDKMHNVFVEFFVAAGVLGVLFLFFFWGRILWIAFLAYRRKSEPIWLFFLLAFFAHLTFLMVSFDTLMSYILVSVLFAGFGLFHKEQGIFLSLNHQRALANIVILLVASASLIFYINLPAFRAYLLTKKVYYTSISITPSSPHPPKASALLGLLEQSLAFRHPYDLLAKESVSAFKEISRYLPVSAKENRLITQKLITLQQTLIRNHPHNPAHYSELAYVRKAFARNLQASEEDLEKALIIAPQNAFYRFQLALILTEAGKLDKASRVLHQLANEGFYEGKTDFYLAIIDFKEGRVAEGEKKALDSLKYFRPRPDEWNTIEKVYREVTAHMPESQVRLSSFLSQLERARLR